MSPAHTFHLANYRVRLQVYDFTADDPKSPMFGKIHFCVGVLHRSANKFSSYSNAWIYHGESLHEALAYAAEHTGEQHARLRAMLPAKFNKYLLTPGGKTR